MKKNILRVLVLSLILLTCTTNAFAKKSEVVPKVSEYERGLTFLRAGDTQSALQSFEASVRNYDNYAEAYKHIALIKHAEGNLVEAIIALDKSLLEQPDAQTYVLQANYFEEYGSRKSAIRVLNKAIDLDRTNADYYEMRAKLKKALGEKDSALVDLYYVQELRAGRTDIVTTNSKQMRTYTVSSPISSETSSSSDMIEMHLYK